MDFFVKIYAIPESAYFPKILWLKGDNFFRHISISNLFPKQFQKNSPGNARFRGIFLLDVIRQLQNNRN